MLNELRQTVVVQSGGLVEVRLPELLAGATVEVIVLLEPSSQPVSGGLSRFIGAAQGNFTSPRAVDSFIRQERET